MGYELSADLPQTFYPEDSPDECIEELTLIEVVEALPGVELEYLGVIIDDVLDVVTPKS